MATTYLTRTIASSGNNKILTNSVWVKRGSLGAQALNQYNGDPGTLNYVDVLEFNSSNQLRFFVNRLGTLEIDYVTNRLFRDVSAWYHIVLVVDTTQATASDRVKLYVNGVQETSFATSTAPSLNFTNQFNNAGSVISPGVQYSTGFNQKYFDGSMAHFHAIDGLAYDADTFGETDATTGIWKPKTAPSVTYGTNGFFIKAENSSALGTDSSGEGNDFTTNGSPTQTVDTPSNVFCTMNPLDNAYFGGTFSNGNTTVLSASAPFTYCTSTFGVGKGKYYMEGKWTSGSNLRFGIVNSPSTATNDNPGNDAGEVVYRSDGAIVLNGVETGGYGSSFASGDILSIALDCDNSKIYFAKNGVYQASGVPSAGTGGTVITDVTTLASGNYFFTFGDNDGGATSTVSFNFGNGVFGSTAVASAQNPDDGIGIFEFDVPAGYRSLCTKSINAQEYS